MPKKSHGHHVSDFINREISLIEFNRRVLEEALNKKNPLLERVKFAAIVSSNLDEFFMVRVAALQDQYTAGLSEADITGYTPGELLHDIQLRVMHLFHSLYNCYRRALKPALKRNGIHLTRGKKLSVGQEAYLNSYFHKTLYPVLTPMVVDISRPFPLIQNRSLNIAVLLENKENSHPPVFATVQVPSVLDRLIEIPAEEEKHCFMFLEDIIKKYIKTLFGGQKIISMACYRIIRSADLGLEEEGAEDLLQAIEQSIQLRKWGTVIRLDIEKNMDPQIKNILSQQLEVPVQDIYEINGPLDLTFLMKISTLKGYDQLRYPLMQPRLPPVFSGQDDVFRIIAQKDRLLHHPYESFLPVIQLVRQAAEDPDVLAIKQVLYRVSGNSPIVASLMRAAENGKQVTVLVELRARFDEEKNILWAKRLEKAGCHVIYGLLGLKIHSKLLLIVRSEENGIRRYLHMGTGNYNDVTATLYEDLGFFTTNPYMCADASALFNMLSGYSELGQMYKMHVAPVDLRQTFICSIKKEAEHAAQGKKSRIIAKMNALVDQKVIEALYRASEAGVKIDLIVRGICCLKPGVKGLSSNIHVRSIVGRFLEHSRIYYFYNDGEEELFLSSADWMPRNLDRRVETLFPLEDAELKVRVKNILNACLKDTVKARIINSDGTYSPIDKRGKLLFNAQEYFTQKARGGTPDLSPEI